MPNYTTNYKLKKPLGNENYNIEDFNTNMDILDTKIKEVETKTDNIKVPVRSVNTKTGDIVLSASDIKMTDGTTLENAITSKADTFNKSDSVSLDSSTTIATSKAVKIAMDKANSAFQSASNGKELIANAITGMGVSASTTETFNNLATKITKIKTGKRVATGSFTDSNLTFVSKNSKSTITKLNIQDLDFTPSTVIVNNYLSVYYNDKRRGDIWDGNLTSSILNGVCTYLEILEPNDFYFYNSSFTGGLSSNDFGLFSNGFSIPIGSISSNTYTNDNCQLKLMCYMTQYCKWIAYE